MPFPMISKRRLFDELWQRASTGAKAPSLRWIVKFARLETERDAELLLKDMAADGVIAFIRHGEYPWLTLKRSTYTGDLITEVWLDPEKSEFSTLEPQCADAPVERAPIPAYVPRRAPNDIEEISPHTPGASGTARKASGVEESTSTAHHAARREAKRIEDRAPPQKEPEAVEPPPAPPTDEIPERQTTETVEAQREGTADALMSPASVDQGSEPVAAPAFAPEVQEQAREPEPQPVGARHLNAPKKPFTADESNSETLGVLISPTLLKRVLAVAGDLDIRRSAAGRLLITEALDLRDAYGGRKHRVSAAVIRAAKAEGWPLDEFVTAMVELGLDAHLAGQRIAAE